MNNKNIFISIGILIVLIGAYYLFMSDNTDKNIPNEQIVVCDENGNRYSTEAEAKAAGLTSAQYGATYCPEYVAAQTGDYTGLTVAQAEEIAEARKEQFRVVEIDGEMQPTTRDFQEGRINASVETGVVTSFTVESMDNPNIGEAMETDEGADDTIIGLTTAEAEVYAENNNVDFRVGTIDGESRPVTLDFRPGRITAEVENDVVVRYTVE